jgi:hypothetical protein
MWLYIIKSSNLGKDWVKLNKEYHVTGLVTSPVRHKIPAKRVSHGMKMCFQTFDFTFHIISENEHAVMLDAITK